MTTLTTFKVQFLSEIFNKCPREIEIRMKRELLSHTNGDEKLLKHIYDEACRNQYGGSSWEKIEAISRFNTLAGLEDYSQYSVDCFSYHWVPYEEKRGIRNE